MVAFRRPKSLKEILVHSEMTMAVNDKVCCKCGDRRCRVRNFLVECIDFRSRVTGNNFVINFNNNNNNYGIYIAPYTLAALWHFTILLLKIL